MLSESQQDARSFPSTFPRTARHAAPAIVGLGTAFPDAVYTQEDIKRLLGIENRVVHRLLDSGHVRTRHLIFPPADPSTGRLPEERPGDLHRKFEQGVRDIGMKATLSALASANLGPSDIDYLVCVTSSGFKVPGISSIISRELGFSPMLHRLDVVGMGCNAGMSALYSLAQWSRSNPERVGLLLCCEINSAAYVRDESIRSGIVNSLFGDGAAAIIVQGSTLSSAAQGWGSQHRQSRPHMLDFASFTLPEQWGAMRFDWNDEQSKWSFFLSKDIPFVIGKNIDRPVRHMLERHGLEIQNIAHWVLHTGGAAVIDTGKATLGLSEHDVRHTRSVLRDYGNLSSGSFLVSLERLQAEGRASSGDLGVFIAMGPGATIETALVQWQ